VEAPLEERIRRARDLQRLEKVVVVASERREPRVRYLCGVPWVAAGDHVRKDDAERPKVAVARRITSMGVCSIN
jgi:hypothetical protein